MLRYNAACRDPAKYDRPHELDLGRSPNRHLAFGRGPHYCVGAPLARLQLTITLEVLPDALPGLRLAAPVALRPTLDVRHPEAVHVAW
ncbi:cytochrome P450 [Thermocatellispora tengchongensis]|uniref:cytochrome P450 n=1 Tax=Thermocatellispora tengchongensis TaxID=1073253 RepID=UPI0036363F48